MAAGRGGGGDGGRDGGGVEVGDQGAGGRLRDSPHKGCWQHI